MQQPEPMPPVCAHHSGVSLLATVVARPDDDVGEPRDVAGRGLDGGDDVVAKARRRDEIVAAVDRLGARGRPAGAAA
jgi:hypothetical protein